MGKLTGKKVLIVIAAENFRDEEYFQPKVALQGAGAEIDTTADTIQEESTGTKQGKAKIDLPLSKVKVKDYNGVFFVGGEGSKSYFKDKTILQLVKDFDAAGKVIAAICIAPVILANAGILKGKRVTVFSSEKEKLEKLGAKVVSSKVVVDGNIVTANGPDAALEFGQRLADVLGK